MVALKAIAAQVFGTTAAVSRHLFTQTGPVYPEMKPRLCLLNQPTHLVVRHLLPILLSLPLLLSLTILFQKCHAASLSGFMTASLWVVVTLRPLLSLMREGR